MTRNKALLAMTVTGALVAALSLNLSAPLALARTGGTGFWPIEEVPVERLLRNIERNRDKMKGHQYWSAFARIHLLAYIRQTETLPASTKRGRNNEEVLDEGPFIGCKPIAPPPDKPVEENAKAEATGQCTTEDRQFDFPAPRGLPEGTLAVRHSVDYHLRLAVWAYERVKAIEPQHIRTRLALAYAYDRLGKIDEAIVELRYIIDTAAAALPTVRPSVKAYERLHEYWELQIVAAEAIEHLLMISGSQEDLDRIERLRPKLETPQKEMLYMTPIFVPLTNAEGMQSFIDPAPHVTFDLTGQGLQLKGGWITKDAAWLVWDPSNKQKIVSGFQLFGSVTWLTPWDNGYLALAALDDDGDGKIAGTELEGLSLWRDVNGNGVSDQGEVKPVANWQIVSLGYHHKRQSKDAWISEEGVTFANGETRRTYDWNIRTQLLTADAK